MDGFRVLIVDDERDFVETLVNRLIKRGITAVGVYSGEEALALLETEVFDVIILDIKMPGGMDGIETLRDMKRKRPQSEVLLLTGHASLETSLDGMKLGAFDYLLKPIKLNELLEKLTAAYETKLAILKKT